jgi:hypothetical protein
MVCGYCRGLIKRISCQASRQLLVSTVSHPSSTKFLIRLVEVQLKSLNVHVAYKLAQYLVPCISEFEDQQGKPLLVITQALDHTNVRARRGHTQQDQKHHNEFSVSETCSCPRV